jgi:thiamine biosynthesis protein ThiS
MEIKLNGEVKSFDGESMALPDLLEQIGIGLDATGVAVAVSWQVVPKAQWAGKRIQEGDEVEVITARQGG